MTDAHVHVGWFVDRYHAPNEISITLKNLGVDTIAVSSTSTCAEEYDLVINELEWLQEEWKDNIFPVLWITPLMIKKDVLGKMINSKIRWKLIKMHWQAHPEFYYNSLLTDAVLNVAKLKDLPILFHTGLFPECHADVFASIIRSYPNRNFILAHGRPIDETIEILRVNSNAFVDTAFMAISDIALLIKEKLEHKIIWGSDYPINRHFVPNLSTEEFLSQRLMELKTMTSLEIYENITSSNFTRLFD